MVGEEVDAEAMNKRPASVEMTRVVGPIDMYASAKGRRRSRKRLRDQLPSGQGLPQVDAVESVKQPRSSAEKESFLSRLSAPSHGAPRGCLGKQASGASSLGCLLKASSPQRSPLRSWNFGMTAHPRLYPAALSD